MQLAPAWILAGHDAILAADIGGTNVRVGIVSSMPTSAAMSPRPMSGSASTGGTSTTSRRREEAIDRIADMLAKLIERATKEKMKLAPFMGIGCPGLIDERGTILKGGQNLPGNWEGEGFHLPGSAAQAPATDRRSRHLHSDP